MAFEVPEHLPRGGLPQDRTSQILTEIGNATHKSLNADLAASWLTELELSIQATKNRISQRIIDDAPHFERQFESSSSIQSRLRELSATVDELTDSLNNPKTGVLPTLLQALTTHASLSAQTQELDTTHRALAHLFRIWESMDELSNRLHQGELPESAQACLCVQNLIAEAPRPLDRTAIMDALKKRYRALNDRLQEQLSDAYARSVMFLDANDAIALTIFPVTKVLPTTTLITLPAILRSLSSDSVSTRLSALRRDLMTKIVENILIHSRPATVSASELSSTLSVSLSSTSSAPFQSLRTVLSFLNSYFFPHLTSAHVHFPATVHRPITTAVLTHLLDPHIPSSISGLASFLNTVDEAVRFEDELLPLDAKDRLIRPWANAVAGHYEKKRRESFLREARQIILDPEDGITFRIEVATEQSTQAPEHTADKQTNIDDPSGWDFEEGLLEENGDESALPEQGQAALQDGAVPHTPDEAVANTAEVDATDGWGWGDDVDGEIQDTDVPQDKMPQAEAEKAEDEDPWDDDGWGADPIPVPPLESKPETEVSSPAPKLAPRAATRLEKFSAKAKGASTSHTPIASPAVPVRTRSPPRPQIPSRSPPPPKKPQKIVEEKETYLVSSRGKKVLAVVEEAMREGQELLDSSIFARYPSEKTTVPGQLLLAAAPSVLDLHRALYSTTHSSLLARDPNLAMRWSNDCRFLSDNVARLRRRHGSTHAEERWAETEERLQTLGELCFEDAVMRQQEAVRELLTEAQGFTEVTRRFEECKSVVARILQEITLVALQWKKTLSRNGYFRAVGQVVDDALFRVMDNILCLEDIPEADSERLSELCESLAPLEDLFVYSPDEQSAVGSHVPLWFKFSYLSWLIKGSIADLSYLFDQGMLVDYEIEELTRLLRALFAETPLRENTIAKIAKGHPPPSDIPGL